MAFETRENVIGAEQQLAPAYSTNGRFSAGASSFSPAPQANGLVNSRYLRILFFFGGIILQIVLQDLIAGRIPLIRGAVRRSRPRRLRRWARRFRVLAIDMGGVMIKLGQFLSARVDVLPLEVTEELQGLQDEVPPESNERILAVLQEELGPLQHEFAEIEAAPLAAASLGQAYRAWLQPQNGHNRRGTAVVIKVQRQNIESIVRTDLAALRIVARWVMRYRPIRKRANVPALMEEFAETLWEELDYHAEAANAIRFAEKYADSEQVYIPAVFEKYSTGRVIVLENVEAIKVNDRDGLIAAGIDPTQVAELLMQLYFDQIFVDGFFHADPHPGNLFIRPRTDLPWESETEDALGRPFWLIFVDFGMVGHVADLMGENLRKVIISITRKDGRALTEAYRDLGFFLPHADFERIVEAQNRLLDQLWGRNIMELNQPDPAEVAEFGQEFRDLLFDFPFQLPQDFIYLGRAMGMVSGLAALLHPEINPWYQVEQFGTTLLSKERRDFSLALLRELIQPYLATPARLRRLLDAAESGRLRVQTVPDRELLRRLDKTEKRLSQLGWSILGAAGMISATLIYIFRRPRK